MYIWKPTCYIWYISHWKRLTINKQHFVFSSSASCTLSVTVCTVWGKALHSHLWPFNTTPKFAQVIHRDPSAAPTTWLIPAWWALTVIPVGRSTGFRLNSNLILSGFWFHFSWNSAQLWLDPVWNLSVWDPNRFCQLFFQPQTHLAFSFWVTFCCASFRPCCRRTQSERSDFDLV